MVCSKCKKDKDQSDFSLRSNKNQKRQPYCKECARQIQQEWYYRSKENQKRNILLSDKISKKKRKYLNKFITRIKLMFGCKICGYKKCGSALEFHHLDKNTKDFSISQMANKKISIQTIKKEIRKCVCVCSNCHKEIHELLINF